MQSPYTPEQYLGMVAAINSYVWLGDCRLDIIDGICTISGTNGTSHKKTIIDLHKFKEDIGVNNYNPIVDEVQNAIISLTKSRSESCGDICCVKPDYRDS